MKVAPRREFQAESPEPEGRPGGPWDHRTAKVGTPAIFYFSLVLPAFLPVLSWAGWNSLLGATFKEMSVMSTSSSSITCGCFVERTEGDWTKIAMGVSAKTSLQSQFRYFTKLGARWFEAILGVSGEGKGKD